MSIVSDIQAVIASLAARATPATATLIVVSAGQPMPAATISGVPIDVNPGPALAAGDWQVIATTKSGANFVLIECLGGAQTERDFVGGMP